MTKVLTLVGTRPEIIRLSRVMARMDEQFLHKVVHSGQNFNYELNQVFFEELRIRKPDYFLGAAGGNAATTIAKVIELFDEVLVAESPDAVLVLGDTNSCLGVLAAKKRHIPIFHMEAGNRCFDARVPEEVNRKLIDHMSDINLVYTEHARRNLLSEGLPADQIFVTGSPMAEVIEYYSQEIKNSTVVDRLHLEGGKFLVASFHREENVDDPNRLRTIVESLNHLAHDFGFPIILSVHPRTRKRLNEIHAVFNTLVHESKPFGFIDYVRLQQDSYCVISDSGTITEEAAILGFPAVTARDTHERPEGMDVGTLVMSGISHASIMGAITISRSHFEAPQVRRIPESYQNLDVSWQVAKLIQSYVGYVNRKTWRKLL